MVFFSFLGEAGGSLGLFLGLSFANAVDLCKWIVEAAADKMAGKKNKKSKGQQESE